MSSFGNELNATRVTATVFDGKGMTIGRGGNGNNVPQAQSEISLLGTKAIFNFDASQSGDPGVADFNMAGKLSQFRIAGLPIVTGPTNTPPNDDEVPVNGLYGFRTAGGDAPAQIFMKTGTNPRPPP